MNQPGKKSSLTDEQIHTLQSTYTCLTASSPTCDVAHRAGSGSLVRAVLSSADEGTVSVRTTFSCRYS